MDRQKTLTDKQEDRQMTVQVDCITRGDHTKWKPGEQLGVLSFGPLTHLLHKPGDQVPS